MKALFQKKKTSLSWSNIGFEDSEEWGCYKILIWILRQKRSIGEILLQLTISNQIWFPPNFSLSDLLHHSWLISIKRMIKNIIVVLLLILVVLWFETCWHFDEFPILKTLVTWKIIHSKINYSWVNELMSVISKQTKQIIQ